MVSNFKFIFFCTARGKGNKLIFRGSLYVKQRWRLRAGVFAANPDLSLQGQPL